MLVRNSKNIINYKKGEKNQQNNEFTTEYKKIKERT